MKKGIALVLILILMTNTVLWADDGGMDDGTMVILIVLGILLSVLGGVTIMYVVTDADAPDDGIRLVSMQNSQTIQQTNSVPVMNVLQHVVVDYNTQENKAYMGFRFQF